MNDPSEPGGMVAPTSLPLTVPRPPVTVRTAPVAAPPPQPPARPRVQVLERRRADPRWCGLTWGECEQQPRPSTPVVSGNTFPNVCVLPHLVAAAGAVHVCVYCQVQKSN